MKFFKNILVNLTLFLISLGIVLAIGELVVRSFYKDKTVLFPRYHTDAQYGQFTLRTIRPNSVFWHTSPDGTWKFATNNKGFRAEKDFEYKKPLASFRLLTFVIHLHLLFYVPSSG